MLEIIAIKTIFQWDMYCKEGLCQPAPLPPILHLLSSIATSSSTIFYIRHLHSMLQRQLLRWQKRDFLNFLLCPKVCTTTSTGTIRYAEQTRTGEQQRAYNNNTTSCLISSIFRFITHKISLLNLQAFLNWPFKMYRSNRSLSWVV